MFYLISVSYRSGSNTSPSRTIIGSYEEVDRAFAAFAEGGGYSTVYDFFNRESVVTPYVIDSQALIWDYVTEGDGEDAVAVPRPVYRADRNELPDTWGS